MMHLLLVAVLALLSFPATVHAQSLLDQLVGDWRMTGTVRGNPVTYTLVARRTLQNKYVELHMTDVSQPPRYEARVFIGQDSLPSQLVVHWLDAFGAAYSIPHGTGSISGDTLRFSFNYASGPFRDTFVFDRAAGAWRFLLESGDGSGGWGTFATYTVRRSP
jgi:hypothetical protein